MRQRAKVPEMQVQEVLSNALALACWIVIPQLVVAGVLLMIGDSYCNAVRQLQCVGDRTLADRLVLVLHVV